MVSPMLVFILATVLYGGTMAQSECNEALTSLSSCLAYLTGGSPLPTPNCCSKFSTVVRSSPQCLCLVVNSNESSFFGFSFNRTSALNLPTACNVQTPSPSQCNGPTTSATVSPQSAPSPSSGSNGPTTAPTPTETKESPKSNESSSNSNRNMILLSLLLSTAMFLPKPMSCFTLFIV